MRTEKEKSPQKSKRRAPKVVRPIFETKEHLKAEKEFEEYYNRLRHMSRGQV